VEVTAVDWAGMIPTTKRITQKFGVSDRFKYIEGDLLEADFGSGYDIATLGTHPAQRGRRTQSQVTQENGSCAQERRYHCDWRMAGK
jgi:hypothetical protein